MVVIKWILDSCKLLSEGLYHIHEVQMVVEGLCLRLALTCGAFCSASFGLGWHFDRVSKFGLVQVYALDFVFVDMLK